VVLHAIQLEKKETETKLRGTRKAFIVGAAEPHQMHDMLVNKVMPEWRKLRDPANFLSKADDWPEIEIEQDTYTTPGNAIASKERWKIAGRWAKIGRKSHVHTIGTKRVVDFSQPWLYGAATACRRSIWTGYRTWSWRGGGIGTNGMEGKSLSRRAPCATAFRPKGEKKSRSRARRAKGA